MLFEICFISFQHPIKPRQQLLCAVVRVQDHRNSVRWCNRTHKMRARYAAQNCRRLSGVVYCLASHELRTAMRELDDNWRIDRLGGLEHSYNHRARCHIECRNCKLPRLRKRQKRPCHVPSHHAGLDSWNLPNRPKAAMTKRRLNACTTLNPIVNALPGRDQKKRRLPPSYWHSSQLRNTSNSKKPSRQTTQDNYLPSLRCTSTHVAT
mmetsp:Transcript_29506/g.64862  ORF Transcript_29506/g.64862 Transcript_29506/m.64862 type:complete len:208 (-) Transcript_29506:365-988(-)